MESAQHLLGVSYRAKFRPPQWRKQKSAWRQVRFELATLITAGAFHQIERLWKAGLDFDGALTWDENFANLALALFRFGSRHLLRAQILVELFFTGQCQLLRSVRGAC